MLPDRGWDHAPAVARMLQESLPPSDNDPVSLETREQSPNRPAVSGMPAHARRGADPTTTTGGRLIGGRYRLDDVIGEGSMGTVWAATDEVLLRQVAIKDIKYPPGTPAVEVTQLQHRLLREARAVAALSHPNVTTVYDVLDTESGPMIVMELLQARPLTEIVSQQGSLSPQQTARIGSAVGSALTAAHARGITHRDVKPANVLIADDGRVTLTDFGIARNTDEHTMTGTGLILGSPAYIAPEIARGQPTGPASDAWSLGALLFYCLEGRPPFDRVTAIATLHSVIKDPVPPHPHSGSLGGAVSGLLIKTPTLRMTIDRALTIMTRVANDPTQPHPGDAPHPLTHNPGATQTRRPVPPARTDLPSPEPHATAPRSRWIRPAGRWWRH